MNDRTVLLCYDSKEEALAKEIKSCIEGIFKDGNNKMVNVELCPSPLDAANQPDNWKDSLIKAFVPGEKSLIFILCSPFSIGQPWVNFISGAATIEIEKIPEKVQPKIIPICHSGQKSKDLPHYLLSRQAMDIQHDSFLDALTLTIGKILPDEKNDRDHQGKLNSFLKKTVLTSMRNVNYNLNSMPNVENNVELADTKYFFAKLKREEDGSISVITDPSSKENSSLSAEAKQEMIEKMDDFLFGKANEVEAMVALRKQNCLYDENKEKAIFYVCLMRKLEVDPNFKSYCSPNGIFEPGYIPSKYLATKAKPEGIDNKNVTQDTPICKLIQERTNAMGHTLWNLKLSEQESVIATIFFNRSEPMPRLEISVWTVINIADVRDNKEEWINQASETLIKGKEETLMFYWIWVKDGEIHYWTFPDEEHIPKFISAPNALNPRLIMTEQMRDFYGRPERYTPFAADDVLGVENVVKEHFSAAARDLLSCF